MSQGKENCALCTDAVAQNSGM